MQLKPFGRVLPSGATESKSTPIGNGLISNLLFSHSRQRRNLKPTIINTTRGCLQLASSSSHCIASYCPLSKFASAPSPLLMLLAASVCLPRATSSTAGHSCCFPPYCNSFPVPVGLSRATEQWTRSSEDTTVGFAAASAHANSRSFATQPSMLLSAREPLGTPAVTKHMAMQT